MTIIAMVAAGAVVALMSFAGSDEALAKSGAQYAHDHGKHKVHRHRRHRHAVHRPYRGPAFTLWQKRYEEPQWNPYNPYGYGTAYAPD